MKAKVIATGEIVKVIGYSQNYSKVSYHCVKDDGKDIWYDIDELAFIEEEKKQINWEQRRFELVKSAVQGLSVPDNGNTRLTINEIAILSINIADAVIAKLKENVGI